MKKDLLALPNVKSIHDLHVWAMSTTENALTAHLVVSENSKYESTQQEVNKLVHEKYKISHVTVQLELNACELKEKCN